MTCSILRCVRFTFLQLHSWTIVKQKYFLLKCLLLLSLSPWLLINKLHQSKYIQIDYHFCKRVEQINLCQKFQKWECCKILLSNTLTYFSILHRFKRRLFLQRNTSANCFLLMKKKTHDLLNCFNKTWDFIVYRKMLIIHYLCKK